MWTPENRSRHRVARPKAKRSYPPDVSDQEWALIAPLLPGLAYTGRPRAPSLRNVINALRVMMRSGREWRMLFKTIHNLCFDTRLAE